MSALFGLFNFSGKLEHDSILLCLIFSESASLCEVQTQYATFKQAADALCAEFFNAVDVDKKVR
jgi:hypothetical protein